MAAASRLSIVLGLSSQPEGSQETGTAVFKFGLLIWEPHSSVLSVLRVQGAGFSEETIAVLRPWQVRPCCMTRVQIPGLHGGRNSHIRMAHVQVGGVTGQLVSCVQPESESPCFRATGSSPSLMSLLAMNYLELSLLFIRTFGGCRRNCLEM